MCFGYFFTIKAPEYEVMALFQLKKILPCQRLIGIGRPLPMACDNSGIFNPYHENIKLIKPSEWNIHGLPEREKKTDRGE